MEGHEQRLPRWALESLHPIIRNGLQRNLAEWRRTLQSHPCSYCGEAGGQADHIVARRQGGGKGWLNLTGACRRCNRTKGQRGLLAFITGTQPAIETGEMPPARFGNLTVALVNLDEARRNSTSQGCGTTTVLAEVLRVRPDAQGALGYRRRHKGAGRRPAWIHVLMTREGECDAGSVCKALGGGGGRTRGGVESDDPLFVPEASAKSERPREDRTAARQ